MWPIVGIVGKWLAKEAVFTVAFHYAGKLLKSKKVTLELDNDEVKLLEAALYAWESEGCFSWPEGVPEEKFDDVLEKVQNAKVAEESTEERTGEEIPDKGGDGRKEG